MVLQIATALPQGSAAGELRGAAADLSCWALYRSTSFTRTPVLCQIKGPQAQYLDFDSGHKWILREEKEQDKHIWYFLLCTLPVCNYFQVRGFSEPDGVSPYLGSSMDFFSRHFFSFFLSPERVLASTTSFRHNFPRSATNSTKNHLLLLWTWLLLALFNVLVLEKTLNDWPLSIPLHATPEPRDLHHIPGKLSLFLPTGF